MIPANDDPFAAATTRPIWLVTLADLALLMIGFFVFIQASRQLDRATLARGIRGGFVHAARTSDQSTHQAAGASASRSSRVADPIPVAAAGMLNFGVGSAAMPGSPAGLVAWASAAARDPRITLKISGDVDGTPDDVDPATGSGAVLATARALAVADTVVRAVPSARITIVGLPGGTSGRRSVIVTAGFAGASR